MHIAKLAIAPLFALLVSCSVSSSPSNESTDEAALRKAAIIACDLEDDVSITEDLEVDIRACDADDSKKTTVCHIPPGNPDNAHTICVGNASVKAHEAHGDTLGPCAVEAPCEPPGDGGGEGSGGEGGGEGSGSGSGSGSGGGIVNF